MKKVNVYNIYDHQTPPDNLSGFIKFLEELNSEIPEKYRPTAQITLSAEGDEPIFKVFYLRPFTPEEQAQHDKLQQAMALHQEKSDRETYERLKRKFEGGAS